MAGLPAATGANTTSVKVGTSAAPFSLRLHPRVALTFSLFFPDLRRFAVVRIRPNIGSDAANVPPRFQRIVVHPVSETTLSADNAGAVGAGAGPASPAAGPSGRAAKQMFTFDRVIGPTEGQPDVWDCAEPLVDSFLEGFNATILAYGQTSSGKSYTMGTDRMSDGILSDVQRQGITPRAVTEIFDRLAAAQREANGGLTFSAKVSYLEIYNEELIDLLAGNRDERPTVQIREDKQGNIFWSGLREVKVSSAHEVMEYVPALQHRATSPDNEPSSSQPPCRRIRPSPDRRDPDERPVFSLARHTVAHRHAAQTNRVCSSYTFCSHAYFSAISTAQPPPFRNSTCFESCSSSRRYSDV